MRIGIVSNIDNGKGLQRDYELLRKRLVELGHTVEGIHFQNDRFRPIDSLDLLVCLETPAPEFWHLSERRWLIPNPEWLEADLDLAPFEKVLAKTREGERLLAARHPAVEWIGWTTQDFGPAEPGAPGVFLHVAGGSLVKGTAAVVEAWRSAPPSARLVIVGEQRALGRRRRLPRNATLMTRISDEAIADLYRRAAWLVEPSQVEGFGHVFREAQSAGCGVITTDAAPMNELAGEAVTVEAAEGLRLKSARTWGVNVSALTQAIWRCADKVPDPLAARRAWESENEGWRSRMAEVFGGTPVVSICFPVHRKGVALLIRSLAALRGQTAPEGSFEVCIGADGPKAAAAVEKALAAVFSPPSCQMDAPSGPICSCGAPSVHESGVCLDFPKCVERYALPCKVTVGVGERPRGDVPHRNHARNAAWRASSAEVCWILDCDFCLEPHAIEHLIAEWRRHGAAPALPVFSPILVGFGGLGPAHWLRVSKPLVAGEVTAMELASARETDEGIFSGYPERATDPELGHSSEPLPAMLEGQPALPRVLLEGLDGFDEGFGEWGGDKEELVDRVRGLARAGLAELRLLTSARAWHQPHERDAGAHTREALKRQEERRRRARMIQGNSSWWRSQAERVREMISDYRARQDRGVAPPPSSVGSVDPILAREVETAIARTARRAGNVLVAGEGAAALAAHLTSRGMTATTVAEKGAPYCSLVAIGVDPGQLQHLVSLIPLGTGYAIFARTGLNGRGNPAPILFQRAAHGLSVKGSRQICGQAMTLMTGKARR